MHIMKVTPTGSSCLQIKNNGVLYPRNFVAWQEFAVGRNSSKHHAMQAMRLNRSQLGGERPVSKYEAKQRRWAAEAARELADSPTPKPAPLAEVFVAAPAAFEPVPKVSSPPVVAAEEGWEKTIVLGVHDGFVFLFRGREKENVFANFDLIRRNTGLEKGALVQGMSFEVKVDEKNPKGPRATEIRRIPKP